MLNKQIRAFQDYLRSALPDSIYLRFANAKSFLKGRPHRVAAAGDGIYRIDDKNGDCIYITQRIRHRRYKRGIKSCVDKLATEYSLHKIEALSSGVIIDCGANVGEIGVWARHQGLEYHAFEPEQKEAACCDLNNYDGQSQTNRMGLWHESGELTLYSKGESADSSLIPINDYDSLVVVKTKTLDEYIEERSIEEIEILKVEAEGAEPEVLQGASEALRKTRYVAADCGGERGVERQHTVLDICNRLYPLGFTMIASNMDRFTLLFENKTLSRTRLGNPLSDEVSSRRAA